MSDERRGTRDARHRPQRGSVTGWQRLTGIRLAAGGCLALATLVAAGPGDWMPARPDYQWSFPRDHYRHEGFKTEWWYFTGQLTPRDDSVPRYGYQFTFFRIGLVPTRPDLASRWDARDLIMGHGAISDLKTGRHRFAELVYRATPALGQFGTPGDSLVAWSIPPIGTPGRWTLAWNGGGFDFTMGDRRHRFGARLTTHAAKPLVLEGPNGYSRKGPGPNAASEYYSFTRLATDGALAVDGDTVAVRGTSWMDHEFASDQLDSTQVGWDWYSLQLDDGRDVMLYRVRGTRGTADVTLGTVVSPAGQPRYLAQNGWRSTPIDTWHSDSTGATYPSGWRVAVPSAGLDVMVEPLGRDQENVSHIIPSLFYWEGAVVVRTPDGLPLGRGYVELVGYGTGTKPAG